VPEDVSAASEFSDDPNLRVGEGDRRGWWPIACIWIGNALNVSTLMTGALLGAGLVLADAFWASLVGFGIVVAYGCFVAMEATDLGLPTSSMSTASLGRAGGRYLISLVLGISLIGWFGVQAGVCGSSFSIAIAQITGFQPPVWACSAFWGALMLVSAVYGFEGVKWVNIVSAPLLFLICLYGVGVSIAGTGVDTVFNYVPAEGIGLVAGINIAVGLWAVGGATIGDFTRYARDRKGAVLSTVVGVLPLNVLVLMMGALLAMVAPESGGDITVIFGALGLAVVGVVALVASTWSVNVGNAYSAGLAFSVMLGKGEKSYKYTTVVAGTVGIVLAAAGILDTFSLFLTVLSACIPALAGTMIADYWLIRKARPENFRPLEGVSVPGLASFVGGAAVALITGGTFTGIVDALSIPFFLGPVNGLVVSMLLYVVIYKAMRLPAFPGGIRLSLKRKES